MTIVGMDFGTTNSGIAAYDGQRMQLIPIDPANRNASIARTALYITNDRQVYIGRNAIDTYYQQNLNRPFNIERVRVGEITLTFAELPSFVRDVYIDKDTLSPGRLFVSFKTALSSLSYLGTVVGSHFYFLEDIIALYLYIARTRAENFLGREVRKIVLGRPVHFAFDAEGDLLAQERLLKAAFRAGYDEVALQYEPIAAAHHYESTLDKEQNVLVFDFGGGTLDISILRIGNPKTRKVLANGGLPIAGDVFDQKLVRAKLPAHFGEGSYYQKGEKRLPVPTSFYEAFSNWQDMLLLQKPQTMEEIKRMERTAERPRQIRALRHLISSSYGLKMYDTVEATKRQLSSSERAAIRLDAADFDVYEQVTRTEFEKIIRSEINRIDTYLDTMLDEAGLRADQIDQVIRTGGSSEIPAFIEILERRFGTEKVRSIDIFSSVTSGLGIIAHKLSQGEIEATIHRKADFALEDRLDAQTRNGIPAVDFEMMKKFVALVEGDGSAGQGAGVVGIGSSGRVFASTEPVAALKDGMSESVNLLISAPPDEMLVLGTSEYRFFRKSVAQLARLGELGLELAETEGLKRDVFGDEYVSGLSAWSGLRGADEILLLTTSGYFKIFKAEAMLPRLEQPVGYHINRLKGDPLTLLPLAEDTPVIVFTTAGRAMRIARWHIDRVEGRLMSIPASERVLAAFTGTKNTLFLLAAADGELVSVSATDIPATGDLSSSGTKVFNRRSLQSVIERQGDGAVYALTNQRIAAVEAGMDKLRLKKGETLVGLAILP